VIEVNFFKERRRVRYNDGQIQAPVTTLFGLKRLNMSSYSLSNVLLPAVIISSAVFSTLTLPFAFIKSEPVVIEIPPLFSGEIQPIFNGEHKDVAIPYIGFAIVVSVGAGMASVEVNRRWQAYRESAIAQKENQKPNLSGQETQQQATNPLEYRPEISALDLPVKDEIFPHQSLTAPDPFLDTQDTRVENPEQVVDATQLGFPQLTLPPQTTTLSNVSEQQKPFSMPDENASVEIEASKSSQESDCQGLDSASSKILESRQQYQRCLIEVPHLERRLSAILVDGQYYSFLRAEKTKERVLEIVAKLSHRIQTTVVTKTEKGYFIWALEPEVKSEA
jgi:hypothetical protein